MLLVVCVGLVSRVDGRDAPPASLAGVTLVLDAEPWTSEPALAPTLVHYRDETTDTRVELIAIDVGAREMRGSRSAQAVVTDWLGQLVATDPRVDARAIETTALAGHSGAGGALHGVQAELVFGERAAFFIGFSSDDLAAARGEVAADDRYAFILLVEGPAHERERLASQRDAALAGLVVPLD